eukprot:s272_g3.t1
MSLSKSTNAELKREQCLMFLREMKQAGMLEDLMKVVRHESSCQMSSGSMTDAAKRRCPDETTSHDFELLHDSIESSLDSSPVGAPSLSLPVPPRSIATPINNSAGSIDTALPDGVSSMEEWGRTVCELPKVKDLGLSYRELASRAEAGDNEMAKYLNWIRGFNGSSVRTRDFKRFLLCDDALKSSPRVYFPGTNEIRRVK